MDDLRQSLTLPQNNQKTYNIFSTPLLEKTLNDVIMEIMDTTAGIAGSRFIHRVLNTVETSKDFKLMILEAGQDDLRLCCE